MKINKARVLRLAFASLLFAVLYCIGISVVTKFEFKAFLYDVIILTLIFFVVTNVVDFIIHFFINRKRK